MTFFFLSCYQHPKFIAHFFCLPLHLQTVRDKCFTKCIPKPGSSISSSESTCVNRCVERYIEATGIISKAVLKLADR